MMTNCDHVWDIAQYVKCMSCDGLGTASDIMAQFNEMAAEIEKLQSELEEAESVKCDSCYFQGRCQGNDVPAFRRNCVEYENWKDALLRVARKREWKGIVKRTEQDKREARDNANR